MIKSFLDLEVYKESMVLAKFVGEASRSLPKEEYDLRSQTRRCCRSIPAQVAEGYGRKYSEKELRKYLNNAAAECNEMITHITIIESEGYWKREFCQMLIGRYTILGKRIASLSKNWKNF